MCIRDRLKNTVLASYYEQHPFHILTMEEYINHLIICLSQLRKDIVIERKMCIRDRSNTVAVVSDGSAVLGLGNIGALAAMPVMDCLLYTSRCV